MNFSEDIKQRIKKLIRDNITGDDSLRNVSRWKDKYHVLSPDNGGWDKPKAGRFGKVYKALAMDSMDEVAVKEINLDFKTDYSDARLSRQSMFVRGDSAAMFDFLMACQESVLQSSEEFNHRNIVHCLESWIEHPEKKRAEEREEIDPEALIDFVNDDSQLTEKIRRNLRLVKGLKFYIVMKLYDENLEEVFSKDQVPGRDRTKEVILGIAEALKFIHSKNYVHRDLKPRNILMTNNFEVALGDFGLCKRVEGDEKIGGAVGTPPYTTAPDEMLTTSFDIWSLGVIVFELFYLSESEDRPSSSQMEQAMTKLVEKSRRGDTKKLKEFVGSRVKPKAIKDLIAKCLQVQSDQRPCAEDFFMMPCFKDLVAQRDWLPATFTAAASETESEVDDD